MILIFSGTRRIEGLAGTYAAPNLASKADIANANVIYTDNKRIIDMAKEFNIEVRDFPKHPPASAKTEDKKEEVSSITSDNEAVATKTKEPYEPEVVMTLITPDDVVDAVNTAETTEVKETTLEEDIEAGMSKEDILAKHNISPQKLGAVKRKLKDK